MSTRTATCMCGQLSVVCDGEPVRVSVCHCLECQKRSGSSYAAQARWPVKRVTITGASNTWSRTGDDGGTASFRFCPTCGSSVWYTVDGLPELVAVAVGGFADPAFPPPDYSVYETRKHGWVAIENDATEHYD